MLTTFFVTTGIALIQTYTSAVQKKENALHTNALVASSSSRIRTVSNVLIGSATILTETFAVILSQNATITFALRNGF
jgi:hypothetical protein